MPDDKIRTATRLGHFDLVQRLLTEGADVNDRDARGVTLLHLAAREGRTDILRLLIDKGAVVQTKTLMGNTALDWAKAVRQTSAIAVLDTPARR